MAKLKIGDVVEIATKNGLRYAQYTHKHKQYGALLRVLEGTYEVRPEIGSDFVKSKSVFVCFFPLNAAVQKGIVSVVCNLDVPVEARPFPVFRAGVVDPATRKVGVWWLWDGEKEWRIGELTPEQRRLSIRGVWNDTFLIERLESGWTPEADPA